MKKIVNCLLLLACVTCLGSCTMKECKCYSTNTIAQDSVLIESATDTVKNFTRGECTDFNKEEMLNMDSLTVVYHTVLCEEE